MILESGMNLFNNDYYALSSLTGSEADISREIDFTIEKPFEKGGSQCRAYCYVTDKEGIVGTGTDVGISFYMSSKAKGGTYDKKINVANVSKDELKAGYFIFDFILPKDTKQIVKLSAKLTGTTPAFTSGMIFGNLEPRVS